MESKSYMTSERGTGRTTRQLTRAMAILQTGKSLYYVSANPRHDLDRFCDLFYKDIPMRVDLADRRIKVNGVGAFIEFITPTMRGSLMGRVPRRAIIDHALEGMLIPPDFREWLDWNNKRLEERDGATPA